jgi:xylulokinase
MEYFIGIDIGTTGAKTVLIDKEGKVISTATVEYPLYTPKPNWAEQNPEDWWHATVKSIKKVLKTSKIGGENIKSIGLTGQMHGLVLLDKENNVLRPCILWCDQRNDEECNYATEKIGKEKLYKILCNPILTGFTLGKLLWVNKNEPQIYEKINKVLLPKDYIRFRLTGEYATDVSDASGMLFLDVPKRQWAREILDIFSIPIEWLPKCYESPEITGYITKGVAKITGLQEGTPVVGGGGDQAAQAVGSGIVKTGLVSVTLGTSGVVFAHTDEVKIDPQGRIHSFCHAIPNKWHVMGVMLSAGGSLRWFRDRFCQEEIKMARKSKIDPYQIMTENAGAIPAGSDGLLFLPYLTGERTPHADPYAKGVFFGISLLHTKPHFTRSILEGVAFGLRDSFEIFNELGIPVYQVRISGGGARSELWRQIIADILGVELVTINVTEGAAYGAAILSSVGAKFYSSVEEATEKMIKITGRTSPNMEKNNFYTQLYQQYKFLYKLLKDTFFNLHKIIS